MDPVDLIAQIRAADALCEQRDAAHKTLLIALDAAAEAAADAHAIRANLAAKAVPVLEAALDALRATI